MSGLRRSGRADDLRPGGAVQRLGMVCDRLREEVFFAIFFRRFRQRLQEGRSVQVRKFLERGIFQGGLVERSRFERKRFEGKFFENGREAQVVDPVWPPLGLPIPRGFKFSTPVPGARNCGTAVPTSTPAQSDLRSYGTGECEPRDQ